MIGGETLTISCQNHFVGANWGVDKDDRIKRRCDSRAWAVCLPSHCTSRDLFSVSQEGFDE